MNGNITATRLNNAGPQLQMRLLLLCMVVVLFCGATSAQQPVITGFKVNGVASNTGPVLASLTIVGSGFGTSQGNNTVSIGGLAMVGAGLSATSWTPTAITAKIPQNATTGGVIVGVWPASGPIVYSAPVTFYIGPLITGLSATSGLVGTPIVISGSGFGTAPGTVSFNGLPASNSWTAQSITATVPSGATEGPIVVTAGSPPQASNPSQTFTPTPSISKLSTYSGVGGTVVTISGNSFGVSQAAGNSTVTFDGVASSSIGSWSNTSITATVPSSGTTGNVVVTVNGVPSAGVMFTYVPSITSLSPIPVLADGVITIGGSYFGAPLAADKVTFNGVAATINSWSDNSIAAVVPPNVTAGNLVVSVNGVSSNPYSFSLRTPYTFSVSYAPNGNLLAATDNINGNWVYAYDDFNRLSCSNLASNGSCASPTSGKATYTYAYDQYGNRWQQNGPYTMLLTFTNTQNQIDGYSYDAAGNLRNDGNHNYVYDAENRIIQVDPGPKGTPPAYAYAYDADGERIQKQSNGVVAAEYLHDLSGNTITEINSSGVWTRSEIYAGGRHLATYGGGASGTTFFVQQDWLGTERARALPNGDLSETCTSLPFGDGQNCSGAADPSPNHFTGKERDSETGLDYFGARYFGSSLGRFQTPDPVFMNIMRVMDPQRLNLYAYGRNNPLLYTDPTGKDIVSGTGDQKAVKAALVEIARHPGGREFLTKLDNLSAQIKVSTGTGLTDRNGNPAYGKTGVQPGSDPHINRVTDSSGKIVDVKSPNIETTVDFGLAKQDKSNGVAGAPQSDAELLGHELKHDENQFFKQPDSEQGATQGIDDILGNKATKESKQGAEEFVDNLLKPNSQNQNNQQQQPPPPPPPKCTGDNKQNCSN